jgi:hypothetical protein
MDWYQFFVHAYANFVGMFPTHLQWLVSLLVVIGIIGAIISLIKHNILFVLLIILVLPVLLPALTDFLKAVADFFLYVVNTLHLTAPKTE